MITLNWSSSFKRAYKKLINKKPSQKDKILVVINQLQQDPFHTLSRTKTFPHLGS